MAWIVKHSLYQFFLFWSLILAYLFSDERNICVVNYSSIHVEKLFQQEKHLLQRWEYHNNSQKKKIKFLFLLHFYIGQLYNHGLINVFISLGEGYPGGVLTCSMFLFLVKFSISLELNEVSSLPFCRIRFPNHQNMILTSKFRKFFLTIQLLSWV